MNRSAGEVIRRVRMRSGKTMGDIARALRELFDSPKLRSAMAGVTYGLAEHYSWERCASETFEFIAQIARQQK